MTVVDPRPDAVDSTPLQGADVALAQRGRGGSASHDEPAGSTVSVGHMRVRQGVMPQTPEAAQALS
jgi:hypothetical protein